MIKLDRSHILPAVYGGIFYGGGGGGDFETGKALATAALDIGDVTLVSVDEVSAKANVACVGFVGAPSADGYVASPADVIRSVELFRSFAREKTELFMANEIGAMAATNGWIQAAYTGTAVLDAPADGRAHPTGVMGAMGLNREPGYVSEQAVIGGPGTEAFFRASIETASEGVRFLAARCGGLLPVVRNNVPVSFVKENGAPGAVSKALSVGRVNAENLDKAPLSLAELLVEAAGGTVVDAGIVIEKRLKTDGGFDVGMLTIGCPSGKYTTILWNEFLELSSQGKRLASFPDLVTLFDFDQMRCVTSAETVIGMHVAIMIVPASKLLLGRGVMLEENLTTIKRLLT